MALECGIIGGMGGLMWLWDLALLGGKGDWRGSRIVGGRGGLMWLWDVTLFGEEGRLTWL